MVVFPLEMNNPNKVRMHLHWICLLCLDSVWTLQIVLKLFYWLNIVWKNFWLVVLCWCSSFFPSIIRWSRCRRYKMASPIIQMWYIPHLYIAKIPNLLFWKGFFSSYKSWTGWNKITERYILQCCMGNHEASLDFICMWNAKYRMWSMFQKK